MYVDAALKRAWWALLVRRATVRCLGWISLTSQALFDSDLDKKTSEF